MTITDPAEYRRIHDIAAAAYEAAVPVDYRYSALALRKAVDAALSALAPQAGDNAEEPVAWCQPNYEGKIHPRKFMVVYEDHEMGNAVFEDEAEAREHFEKASIAWNCYLFGLMPAASHPCTSTPVVSQNAPGLEDKGGGSVDSLASAFQDGFTNGNASWDETPEYHKEMFREGVLSLLREQSTGTHLRAAMSAQPVTAAMVEAAKSAYWTEAHSGGGYGDKCYEAAIQAALSAAPKQKNSASRDDASGVDLVISNTDRLKIPRLTSAWAGIENAPEALVEHALKAAKVAMVEATGLSPMWGEAPAWAGARAAVTAYLAAIADPAPPSQGETTP